MHILVCVKQTPKSEQVKIDLTTGCLIRDGIENVLNPYDRYALESAVNLKEQLSGCVSVLTMGPACAAEVLRTCVALGADKAYHLCDKTFAGSDTWATSYGLSAAVKKINNLEKVDLILCGKQTNDSDTGNVGPQLAAWLNWPSAAFVKHIMKADLKAVTVECLANNGINVLELPYPCVLSVEKEISCPRVASVKGRLAAKRAEITQWTAEDIGADKNKLGLAHSPTQVVNSFAAPRTEQAVRVDGNTTQEKATQLVALLKENKYL